MKINRKIKVIHLASFLGNIGDFANHQAFYKQFKKNIPAEFSQVEIRKFYKNRAEIKFDDSFVQLINRHDMFILGGGGFFDLNWDYSNTGTTIDFSEKFIQDIKIPVLVNAMGYHEFKEVKEKNIKKFKNFLEIITSNKNWFLSVRNDGSFSRMQARYGNNITDKIIKVPDNGFFYCPENYYQFHLQDKDTIWIGMNITNDLFNKNFNNGLNADAFNYLMAQFVNRILKSKKKYKIIFFPHAHQDIGVIGAIMSKIEDKYKREKILVAPLFTQEKSIGQIFDLYRICSCVIAMRFHANVYAIGMNIPTIGLAGHQQIYSLYEELALLNRCVMANNDNFTDELFHKLSSTLNTEDKIVKDYVKINATLNKQAVLYHNKIKDWIKNL